MDRRTSIKIDGRRLNGFVNTYNLKNSFTTHVRLVAEANTPSKPAANSSNMIFVGGGKGGSKTRASI